MRRFFEFSPIRFQCTQCGACCRGQPGAYVFVTDAEIETIRQGLGLPPGQLPMRYLLRTEEGHLSLQLKATGNCVFLDAQGKCSIYAFRPSQCRTYPFWPEIVASEHAWLAEASRCEGIGQGEPVAPATIHAQLQYVTNPDGDSDL